MHRSFPCSLALALALALPGTALAQGFGDKPATPSGATAQTETQGSLTMAGRKVSVTVPAGWQRTDTQTGAAVYSAPDGKAQGLLLLIFFTIDNPDFQGKSALEVTRTLGANYQKNEMTWAKLEDPQEGVFMGMPAGMLLMRGTNPETKVEEVTIIVSAVDGKTALIAAITGRTDDVQENSEQLAMLITSAKLGGGEPPAVGKPGGKNGPAGGPAGTKNGGKPPGAPPLAVVDPPWGLEVRGLSGDWQVLNQEGRYVFLRTGRGTPATITVSHAWADAGYGKRLKGAKKGRLGELDAFIVESANRRVYHVVTGEQATIIDLTSNKLAEATTSALPEFVAGLRLTKVTPHPRMDRRKGVAMSLANGVTLSLGKGWVYEDAIAGGGNYSRQDGGTYVFAQVRSAPAGGDPFAGAVNAVRLRCVNFGGELAETRTRLGGRDARRLSCTPKKGAKRELAPMTAVVADSGKVSTFVFLTAGAKALPEARLAEVLGGLVLP
jgi:hypothetical protein